MSTDSHTDSESPIVKFLDSFLQEKNIKWVLTAGMMILLGSSLMMVTRGWHQLDSSWKFAAIIAYTAAIFGAGHWSYHKLGLRKTGTGLLALTVLLVPLSFVAWFWIWNATDSTFAGGTAIGLLALNMLMAGYASRKTFAHFLQGDQVSFVICYLALSVAGAIAPAVRESSDLVAWIWSFGLWAVFTIGAVKVNRHVFWLTEEHRQPRIFGFFPVLLLGTQFLLVFAMNFADSIPRDWFGLACVLVAIPVLLTADAVARVFQERTGNIVRPIPWPIILPTVSGLTLCAIGTMLAISGVATSVPYAVVPTAALAAAMMAVIARRTGKPAFAWAMLLGITLAYNFSPVFFQQLVRTVMDHSASALRESRLPYAFYGLTYLPLIAVGVIAAGWLRRRGDSLFSIPLQRFCYGVSLLLLVVSTTHAKALFPVAAVMTFMMAWQAHAFRSRHIALTGMIAFLVATVGLTPFARGVWNIHMGDEMYYVFPTIAASALLIGGRRLDFWIESLQPANLRHTPYAVSLVATVAAAAIWLTQLGIASDVAAYSTGAFIFTLLAIHSIVWIRRGVSWVVYGLTFAGLLRLGIAADLHFNDLTSLAILLLVLQWFASYLLARNPSHRIARAWSEVSHASAFGGLLFSAITLVLPRFAWELLGIANGSSTTLDWLRDILLVVWCFDAARRPCPIVMRDDPQFRWERFVQPVPAFLGSLCVLGVAGCTLIRVGGEGMAAWLPLTWTIIAAAMIPLTQRFHHRLAVLAPVESRWREYYSLRATVRPVDFTMCTTLIAFSALQLFFYSDSIRIAGYVALAALLLLTFLRDQYVLRVTTAAFINWMLLLSVIQFCSPSSNHLLELLSEFNTASLWFITALGSVSLLVWQRLFARDGSQLEPSQSRGVAAIHDIALVQRAMLRVFTLGALLLTLGEPALSAAQVLCALFSFAAIVASELRSAIRNCDVVRVWTAEAIAAAACLYLLWFEIIGLRQDISLFVPLVLGFAAFAGGVISTRRERTKVLAQPLLTTGLWLPLLTVVIGIVRHLSPGSESPWIGINSLAILLSGGFYFWRAMERQSKGHAVLSAAILNIAAAFLWNELEYFDPQFYLIPIGVTILVLVEILKREIPTAWHNPLRYIGALTILVSPTFHIVDKSWVHLIALMVLATGVLLVSIGLRLRALMYTGTAFLVADLVAMVICGGIDHPNLLWIAGIGFGAAIITLGAVCENNREKVLQRIRIASAQMEHWT